MSQDTFAKRRKSLMSTLGEGVLVMAGASEQTRNSDVHYKFRQNSDFFYLTGFDEPDASVILSHKEGILRSILIVPPKDKVKEIWEGIRLGEKGAVDTLGFDEAYSNEDVEEVLLKELGNHDRLFYEFNLESNFDGLILDCLNHFRNVGRKNPVFPRSLVFYHRELGFMRHVKNENEQQMMRKATGITCNALNEVMRNLKPGMNESEVQAILEYEYRRHGCDSGYGSIVAGGANATILHYTSNNSVLEPETLLLIDSGCEYKFYCSDVTRCYPVDGKFTPEARAVYEIVLEANKKSIEQSIVGSNLKDVHQASLNTLADGLRDLGLASGSRESIQNNELKLFYMHNTSHWLGMDVHDVGQYDREGVPISLQQGMAFTIEPGLYFNPAFSGLNTKFDGIGVRIEDDIIIQSNYPEVLSSQIPKEIQEIEDFMAES